MSKLSKALWEWPDGLVWRITHKKTIASRQKRFALFMKVVRPQASDRVVDVGVDGGERRGVNFFEDWYPYPKQLTAVAPEQLPNFKKLHPESTLVVADGRKLPFKDDEFDIYFSNAVLEHVGSFEQQKQFVHEACRVARRVFMATPYRWFPIDFHTMMPFAHFLPLKYRNVIYRKIGHDYYASEDTLRLTDIGEIKRMLPTNIRMTVYKQRFLGFVANINILLEKND